MDYLRGEDLTWLTGAQYMPAGCNCGPNSLLAQALGCHCVRRGILQSLPVSCHFRGCKVPLFRIVSGAISSELAFLHSSFCFRLQKDTHALPQKKPTDGNSKMDKRNNLLTYVSSTRLITDNLSDCFNGHLPGGPGLAGSRMS